MKPFSLLVKPASADCNLKCTYCFYLDHISMYPEKKIHRMDDVTLEKMIASYMKTKQPAYSFGWQGGEPTLMGVDFFKKVVELQKKYSKPGIPVSNGLQTNGTLITDDMAKLFHDYNFLVGVSVDGPEPIHNKYRVHTGDRGSHHLVMEGIHKLKKHKVEFNILTLVSESNVNHAKEVYSYLKEQGFYYHQYIPCVEFDSLGSHVPYSITGKQWGQFLIDIFNLWKKEDVFKVSIRKFDAILSLLIMGQINMCTMSGHCCQYFVVEHNGDVFPCDFFVEKQRNLGNVHHESWQDMQTSKSFEQFGAQKNNWNDQCKQCDYIDLCSGDCLKHRIYNQNEPEHLSWLCEGWKMFYDATLDEFKAIAKNYLKSQGKNHSTLLFDEVKRDRNGLCFCGSQKKFKHCHGKLK